MKKVVFAIIICTSLFLGACKEKTVTTKYSIGCLGFSANSADPSDWTTIENYFSSTVTFNTTVTFENTSEAQNDKEAKDLYNAQIKKLDTELRLLPAERARLLHLRHIHAEPRRHPPYPRRIALRSRRHQRSDSISRSANPLLQHRDKHKATEIFFLVFRIANLHNFLHHLRLNADRDDHYATYNQLIQ